MKHYFALFLICTVLVSSCENSEKTISVQKVCVPPSVIDKQELQRSEKDQRKKAEIKKSFKKNSLSVQALYNQLEEKSQKFTIDPNKDTIIKGTQGTLVDVKRNSFLLNGKPYTGAVTLKVKECYTPEEMIFANLTTTSNDRLLESGGMLHIEAFAGTQPLTLNESKPITLKMPSQETKDYMQLFYATNNKDGAMNWIQASSTKPQFSQSADRNKKRRKGIQPGAYLVGNNGFSTMTSTISIVYKDGQKRDLSSTSYTNASLCQTDRKTIKMSFEMDEYGVIRNQQFEDSIMAKRYRFTTYRLESIGSTSLLYYPYNPGAMKMTDCNLLFTTDIIGKGVEPAFVVRRNDYIFIRQHASKNTIAKIVVENSYQNYSRSFNPNCFANDVEEKLTKNGGNLDNVCEEELEYYIFSIQQLGWINCDRFYNVPSSQKINFTINHPYDDDIKLVFNNIRSIIPGQRIGDQIVFSNIPENEPVTLIGMRIVNGKAELAILKTTTQKNFQDKLTYTTVSVEEMKNKIKTVL